MKALGMMNRGNQAETTSNQTKTSIGGLPDVYYIIMDSYPSSDNLKKYYNYDNTGFTKQLSDLGFRCLIRLEVIIPIHTFLCCRV